LTWRDWLEMRYGSNRVPESRPFLQPERAAVSEFLVRRDVQGPVLLAEPGSGPIHGRPGFIVVITAWDPGVLFTMLGSAGAVIIASSPKSHAAMAALALNLPSCVLSPTLWQPGTRPLWMRLYPTESCIQWT